MRVNKILFIGLAVVAIFALTSPAFAADPWFVEPMKGNEAILDPGTTTFCDKGFTVHNMGKDLAEVNVIMGNGASYHWDQLEPNAAKSYSLSPGSPFDSVNADTVHIDDARIVNTTAGDSKIRVECKR